MSKTQNIGNIIQKLRKDTGLTQEELAIKSGVPYTTLIKIEGSQVKNPTIKTIKKIADALSVTTDDLIKLEEK
jgi:transcriptional regulator with XRE-family HTH domain